MKKTILAKFVLYGCIALLVAGFIFFPDSPIKPCGSLGGTQFCGRYGAPHSIDDYENFKIWEKFLFLAWPFGIFSAYYIKKNS